LSHDHRPGSRIAGHAAKMAALLGLASACAVHSASAQGGSDSPPILALVGGRIYRSPDAVPLDDGVALVRDGLITAVGRRGAVPIPPGADVLECSGAVIVAGFWNSHVHFTEPHWIGADTLPAPSLARHLREMLSQYGFVRVLDTGSWLANTLALRRRIDSGEIPGPAILTTGSGFVPPLGSPFYILPARLPELRSPADAKVQVASQLQDGADAIKLFTGSIASPTRVVPMPLAVVRAATTEAHHHGRLVLAHPTNNDGLEAALEGGVDILAHTTPDGGPWEPRLPERMKRARLALIPTLKLWTFELARKGADPATTQRFLSVAIGQLRAYAGRGGEILFGTDVGYMTEYDPTDEYLYMHRAGMSFHQILAALTTAPAKRFGSGRTTGRLARGLEADMVVLEGDPAQDIRALARVRYALRHGRLVYSRE
jgi:imidazolonepropionase-like amidohydrolase